MHKTVTITIGGALFQIEEDAYDRLEEYLSSIRKHFASYKEQSEIVEDIESRIAEEFGESLTGRKKVLTAGDVEDLITRMGTVEDFKKFEASDDPDATQPEKPTVKKLRLYRDADDQVIAGVCAGIANAVGIDPIILRLVFGLSIVLGGFGFILYIILWVSLPQARTAAEKVEMRRGRVTLSAIQERIDEAMPPEKRRGMVRRFFQVPLAILRAIAQAVAKVVMVVVPLLARIVGIAIVIGCAVAIASMTTVFFALLLNPSSPYIGFPLREVVGQTAFVLLLLSGFFVALVPVLFILLVGSSLASLRSLFSLPGLALFIGLWITAIVIGGATLFSNAPTIEAAAQRYSEAYLETVSRPVDVDPFTAIAVGGNAFVDVRQGETLSVEIEATQRDQQYIAAEVIEGTLTLTQMEGPRDRCILFCGRRGTTLHVTVPALQTLSVGGVSWGLLREFSGSTLRLEATQNASIEGENVHVGHLDADISDAASIHLTGQGGELTLHTDGVAVFQGPEFSVMSAFVDVNDMSRAVLDVRHSLSGYASDAGQIFYDGAPEELQVETSGGADLENADK